MLKILEFQVLIILGLVEMEGVSSSLLFLFPRQLDDKSDPSKQNNNSAYLSETFIPFLHLI